MCRNIKLLFNFDPPVTEGEIRAASLQYVRKISGFAKPSHANEAAFNRAVEEVAAASARLASRHGIELERRPEAARAMLGEDVWELLRPDRPEPADRHGPGVPREQVAAVIEALESL